MAASAAVEGRARFARSLLLPRTSRCPPGGVLLGGAKRRWRLQPPWKEVRDLLGRCRFLAHLDALPGGPAKHRMQPVTCGHRPVSVPGPLRKQASDGPDPKTARRIAPGCIPLCGESEIRTRDTLLGYTRFPGVPLQPLEHLSKGTANIRIFLRFNTLWKRFFDSCSVATAVIPQKVAGRGGKKGIEPSFIMFLK